MNQVFLIGNMATDPSMKVSQNGNPVCTFRLAVNSGWGDNKKTSFLHIVTFGKRAETCGKYLLKGRKVAVRGSIVTDSYEKDGRRNYTTDIYADEVEFLSGKNDEGAPARKEAPQEPQRYAVPEGFEQMEADAGIPF